MKPSASVSSLVGLIPVCHRSVGGEHCARAGLCHFRLLVWRKKRVAEVLRHRAVLCRFKGSRTWHPLTPRSLQFQGGVWSLSTVLCDALMTMDVMLCTASIFNLCAISVDR